jgi:hypothetical protein
MVEAQFDHRVPELTEQEDTETLAAIDRGIEDGKEGRVVSLEDARRFIDQWHSNRHYRNTFEGSI